MYRFVVSDNTIFRPVSGYPFTSSYDSLEVGDVIEIANMYAVKTPKSETQDQITFPFPSPTSNSTASHLHFFSQIIPKLSQLNRFSLLSKEISLIHERTNNQ